MSPSSRSSRTQPPKPLLAFANQPAEFAALNAEPTESTVPARPKKQLQHPQDYIARPRIAHSWGLETRKHSQEHPVVDCPHIRQTVRSRSGPALGHRASGWALLNQLGNRRRQRHTPTFVSTNTALPSKLSKNARASVSRPLEAPRSSIGASRRSTSSYASAEPPQQSEAMERKSARRGKQGAEHELSHSTVATAAYSKREPRTSTLENENADESATVTTSTPPPARSDRLEPGSIQRNLHSSNKAGEQVRSRHKDRSLGRRAHTSGPAGGEPRQPSPIPAPTPSLHRVEERTKVSEKGKSTLPKLPPTHDRRAFENQRPLPLAGAKSTKKCSRGKKISKGAKKGGRAGGTVGRGAEEGRVRGRAVTGRAGENYEIRKKERGTREGVHGSKGESSEREVEG
ncbi:hypothetical protein C8R47DRAFT_1074166 [Mycena vitilis]|nr:hypothetical protein C8R47DRAFT_1074166 [Mycena vitilis]